MRRRFWFRVAAILLGLAAVGLLELGLRLAGIGGSHVDGDPYVGFTDVRPLFVPSSDASRFEIAEERLEFFRPGSFAADKSPNGGRIFCLGGSTVQGRPYSTETSFTTWLELSLTAAEPDRDWEVVNCGGVSYASYRLVPILKEVLKYQPDVIVLYTGHNEFLEERTYEGIKHRPQWMQRVHGFATGLHIYGLARQWSGDGGGTQVSPVELTAEVDALLDYQGGMEAYRRDADWQAGVVQHFDHNVRRMIRLANEAQVPLILVNPVSNLRDTPPFKSQLAPDLSDLEKKETLDLWQRAKDADWNDLKNKLNCVEDVFKRDPGYADAQYLYGRVLERAGRPQDAKKAYRRAKDADVCPLRMLDSMHSALKSAADETDTPMVDANERFARNAADGIPGNVQLIDHIHPRIIGHQEIAAALLEALVELGVVSTHHQSKSEQERLYRANFDSLNDGYYLQGEERLRGLQGWAAGRAEKLRLPNQ